jgi:hypothetical protein
MFPLCFPARLLRSVPLNAAIFLLSAAAAAQSLVPATVTDPSFDNMKAVTVNIPAGWKLQGIMTISPCTSLPAPVFRAYSRDGLSEFRAMPVFGWKWATNPRFLPKDGCLPLTGKMTAADFLNQYIQMLDGGVHIVGPMPVDAAFRQRAQNFAEALNKHPRHARVHGAQSRQPHPGRQLLGQSRRSARSQGQARRPRRRRRLA